MRARWIAAILLSSMACLPAVADQPAANGPANGSVKPATKPAPVNQPKIAKSPAVLAAEREADALAFAREHHPELAALIDKLRHDNRREYERALRELSQARERLMRLKKQSAEQYGLALAAWKLDSRAQLLAARMTVAPTPGLKAELRQLLSERAVIRLKEYQAERARLQDRLTKLNTWIDALEADKNAVVEKDLQRVMKSVARSRRPANKPANKASQPAVAAKATVTEPPRPPAVPTAASVTAPADAPTAARNGDKQH
jgi:hypothetical protein